MKYYIAFCKGLVYAVMAAVPITFVAGTLLAVWHDPVLAAILAAIWFFGFSVFVGAIHLDE